MSTRKQRIEALIRHELRAYKRITLEATRLYIKNRISYKRFKDICDEEL